MSGHLWDVKTFKDDTVSSGVGAYLRACKNGLGFTEALRFSGYFVETVRQNGGSYNNVKSVWDGAVRSKHRYARGHNGSNYLWAGRRMFCEHLRDLLSGSRGRDNALSDNTRSLYTELYAGVRADLDGLSQVMADSCEEDGLLEAALLLRGRTK